MMSLTQCSNPPELSEDQLYAVVDGLGDEKTFKHLAVCLHCSKRLTALQRVDIALEARFVRFECPSSQVLMRHQLNDLEEKTNAEIGQHVRDCPRCQQELDMLALFLSEISNELEPAAPSHKLISVPHNLWQATHGEISGSLALKGLRGSGDERTYDVKAGSASLFIEVKSLANNLLLTGQVIDEQVDWRGSIAEIHQNGAGRRVQILDNLCEFKFDLSETSPLDLYITSPKGIVLALEQLTP